MLKWYQTEYVVNTCGTVVCEDVIFVLCVVPCDLFVDVMPCNYDNGNGSLHLLMFVPLGCNCNCWREISRVEVDVYNPLVKKMLAISNSVFCLLSHFGSISWTEIYLWVLTKLAVNVQIGGQKSTVLRLGDVKWCLPICSPERVDFYLFLLPV